MEDLIPVIAILSAVALPIFLGMYVAVLYLKNRHEERMKLIEQGIIPPEETKPIPNKYRSLRSGILLTAVALGLIISLAVVHNLNLGNDQAFWVVAPGVVLFLGIGYLVYYFLVRKKEEFREKSEISE